MNKEELLKALEKLPKVETNNAVGSMDGINIDDLMSAVDRFNKVLDYNDLLKENKQLKKQNNNFKTSLDESQEVILDYIKENQELKLELSGYRQAILNNKEMLSLKEKNQELKKQNQKLKEHLEAYETYFNRFFKINNKTYDGKIVLRLLDKKETQQKEFIKYLEEESKEIYRDDGLRQNTFRQILQKYKEIIGISNEKEN